MSVRQGREWLRSPGSGLLGPRSGTRLTSRGSFGLPHPQPLECSVIIGVLHEALDGETRMSATPGTVEKLIALR